MARNNDNRYSSYRDSSYDYDYEASRRDELRRRALSRRSGNRVLYNEREERRQEELQYSNNPISIGSPNASLYDGSTTPRSRAAQDDSDWSAPRHASYGSRSGLDAEAPATRDYSQRSSSASRDYRYSTAGADRASQRSSLNQRYDAGQRSADSSRDYRRSSYSASRETDRTYPPSRTADRASSASSRSYGRTSYGRAGASEYDAYDYQAYSRDKYGSGASGRSADSRRASGYSRSSRQQSRSARSGARDHETGERVSTRKTRASEHQSRGIHLPAMRSSRGKSRSRAESAQAADVSRYSRATSSRQYADRAKQKHTKRNVIIGIVAVIVLLAILFGGRACAFISEVANNLSRGISSELRAVLVDTQYKDDPFYMVLLGVDKSEWREDDPDFGGSFRTDTMMLARVDPQARKVTIVSLMRDIRVNLGEDGDHKLNEAYVVGGPELTIEAISKLAGVPISHYAEIDLNGFEAVVDALGGVEVNVPIEIDDPEAGGHLNAGLQTLTGEQALILCRSRHAYDDYGPGDMYRASNQRAVLSAVVQKLLSSDILTIADTVSTLSEYVTTDLSVSDIIGYAQVMRGIDAGNDIYTVTLPTGSLYIDEGWYEYVKLPEWTEMMNRINDGLPPTDSSETDETGTIISNAGNTNAENGNAGTKSRTPVDWTKFNGYNYYDYA